MLISLRHAKISLYGLDGSQYRGNTGIRISNSVMPTYVAIASHTIYLDQNLSDAAGLFLDITLIQLQSYNQFGIFIQIAKWVIKREMSRSNEHA